MNILTVVRYILVISVISFQAAFSQETEKLDFTFHKLESGRYGNTLLVIGGIQGDEPGGFNAASLLVTHYKIKKGNVWVIPNLNFISIVNRSRGVYGDLNRKFDFISDTDPDFNIIKRVKSLITKPEVDMVLNLHDGSGFYNPVHIDNMKNPMRWGQSVIIDQKELECWRFCNLYDIANSVVKNVNQNLFSENHAFHVKDTNTRMGDTEMAKTLTYFAVLQSKPAFGIEASKSFPTYKRTYYHLLAIEAFMNTLGIEFEKDFELSARGVVDAINNNVKLAFFNKRITIDVKNARSKLWYIPLKKSSELDFISNNPLIAVLNNGDSYKVYYGNRSVTRIHPQYFDYDYSITSIPMEIDGEVKDVIFGDIVNISRSFTVLPVQGFRVNVIGYTQKEKTGSECGVKIKKDDILKRFSVDRAGNIYRVEVYKADEEKFTGMVLVNFGNSESRVFPKESCFAFKKKEEIIADDYTGK